MEIKKAYKYASVNCIGLNGKFLRFSNEKSIFFKYIYNINQLYNFHCLLLPSPNVSQAFQFRPYKNFLVAYAYAFSSKTQKLSVQPNININLWFMVSSLYKLKLFKQCTV
jgi:hypothetical protein